MARDVYIAGVSRSGSTILAMTLGRHPDIAVVGETNQIPARWSENRPCGCRLPLQECSFWSKVAREVDPASLGPHNMDAFREAMRAAHGARVLVDVSKHATYLDQIMDDDALLIHLVRDPRGHALSAFRGWIQKNEEGQPTVRATARVAVSWRRENQAAGRLLRGRHGLRLRYEDFALSVEDHYLRVLDLIGLEPAAFSFREHHIPTGNPARWGGVGQEVRPDVEWLTRMGAPQKAAGFLAGLPLSARYGYRLNP